MTEISIPMASHSLYKKRWFTNRFAFFSKSMGVLVLHSVFRGIRCPCTVCPCAIGKELKKIFFIFLLITMHISIHLLQYSIFIYVHMAHRHIIYYDKKNER